MQNNIDGHPFEDQCTRALNGKLWIWRHHGHVEGPIGLPNQTYRMSILLNVIYGFSWCNIVCLEFWQTFSTFSDSDLWITLGLIPQALWSGCCLHDHKVCPQLLLCILLLYINHIMALGLLFLCIPLINIACSACILLLTGHYTYKPNVSGSNPSTRM